MWTQFYDMNSGGGQKEKWSIICIELPEETAKVYFYNRFGHSPNRVSCTCCGEDYSTSTGDTLEDLTHWERRYTSMTLEQFERQSDVLIIRKKDIDPALCEGDVPEQGYVWVD